MSKGPIRRGQLIAPFGVGALVVVKDGTSVLSGGLDYWYVPEGGLNASQEIDVDEYRVEEWRLQRHLNTDHFRLPPDFRRLRRGQSVPNTGLTIPFLRFPTWHFCPFCKILRQLPMSTKGAELCMGCLSQGKRNYLFQVPFVAICDHGHIQDFPWREWVHRSISPTCNARMRLIATGGASLADQKVTCECSMHRSLSNITTAAPDGSASFVSTSLDRSGVLFPCQGMKPWLGDGEKEQCSRPLRGSLRSASNVYYARVYSAIYLPRASQGARQDLLTLMQVPPLSTLIVLLHSLGKEVAPQILRQQHRELLKPFTDDEIYKALSAASESNKLEENEEAQNVLEPPETAFRRAEFEVLRKQQNQIELMTRRVPINCYSKVLWEFFSDITLVDKLRETRVFSGFSRIFPDDALALEQHKNALRRRSVAQRDSWLPANIVYGEGIFLQFNEKTLQNWEMQPDITRLVDRLERRYSHLQQHRKLRDLKIEPRFVLIHTFAHILINKLTFECGYSSASLRERLYISSDRISPMAGLLIYTAAGDSEGTMGGLVRMGKPGYLEPIIEKAVRDAEWCSTDPVCMEIGERHGQGPDGCNAAACHNCALVPETACEHFNRFLDRTLIVGSRERQNREGFFRNLLE